MKKLTQRQLKAIEDVRENPNNFKKYNSNAQFEELALEAISLDDANYQYVSKRLINNEFNLKAVSLNGLILMNMKEEHKTEEVIETALKQNGLALSVVANPTDKMKWIALSANPGAIRYIESPTEEMMLYLVRKMGFHIRFIKNPTEDVCIEAVKDSQCTKKRKVRNVLPEHIYGPLALIQNQTERVCLEAVKVNGLAIKYAKFMTEEIQLEAVKQNGLALQYIENPSPNVCMAAYEQTPEAEPFLKL